jgi:hypothetical protein
MDWVLVVLLVVIAPVFIIGYVGLFYEWKDRNLPIPRRPHPSYIFRFVKRDERAVYVRIMRRSMAVAFRDLGRSMTVLQRTIGKELLPPIQRLADALDAAFKRPHG